MIFQRNQLSSVWKPEGDSKWFDNSKTIISRYHISKATKLSIFKTSLLGEAWRAFEGFYPHEKLALELAGRNMKNIFAPDRDGPILAKAIE